MKAVKIIVDYETKKENKSTVRDIRPDLRSKYIQQKFGSVEINTSRNDLDAYHLFSIETPFVRTKRVW